MRVSPLRRKLAPLLSKLNERQRRLLLASEARQIGWGGIAQVHRAIGVSRRAIAHGLQELDHPESGDHIRRPGGGRKRTVTKDPTLRSDLVALVEPATRGDPESRLRWTCKSLRALTRELRVRGPSVSTWLVARALGRGWATASRGTARRRRAAATRIGTPSSSTSTPKCIAQQTRGPAGHLGGHEEEGARRGVQERRARSGSPRAMPTRVRVHDFLIPEKGKAIPYGVYDLTRNDGWVSVGIDHDTASFAVGPSVAGGQKMGEGRLSRRDLADDHRRFRRQQQRSLPSVEVGAPAVRRTDRARRSRSATSRRGRASGTRSSIGCSRSSRRTGGDSRLVEPRDDRESDRKDPDPNRAAGASRTGPGQVPEGRKITVEQMATIQLEPEAFHGDWNYTIRPRSRTSS